jgi:hypothetical protein
MAAEVWLGRSVEVYLWEAVTNSQCSHCSTLAMVTVPLHSIEQQAYLVLVHLPADFVVKRLFDLV